MTTSYVSPLDGAQEYHDAFVQAYIKAITWALNQAYCAGMFDAS
jgi:hypothetical protein